MATVKIKANAKTKKTTKKQIFFSFDPEKHSLMSG